jgi:hypothetical protein
MEKSIESSLDEFISYVNVTIQINNLTYIITAREYNSSEYLKSLVDNAIEKGNIKNFKEYIDVRSKTKIKTITRQELLFGPVKKENTICNFELLDDEGENLEILISNCQISTKILDYLFSVNDEINLEYIYDYYNYANYLGLRTQNLENYIKNYVNGVIVYDLEDLNNWYHKKLNLHIITCTMNLFTSLLRVYELNKKIFDLNTLFDNTINLGEIYLELKEDKSKLKQELLESYIYHIEAVLKVNSITFDTNRLLVNLFEEQREGIIKSVSNLSEFKQRFSNLTSNLVKTLNWKNTIVAGGMPLEAFSLKRLNVNTDLDIFVYGDDHEEISQRHLKYFNDLALKLGKTIYFAYYFKIIIIFIEDTNLIVQLIIHGDKQTKYDVIDNFDLSHTNILYDGENVYCTNAFLECLKTNKTKVNTDRVVKPSRIENAIKKGFEVIGLSKENEELKLDVVKDEYEILNIKSLMKKYKNCVFTNDYKKIPKYQLVDETKNLEDNAYNFLLSSINLSEDNLVFKQVITTEHNNDYKNYLIQRIPIVDKQDQHYVFKTKYLLGSELFNNNHETNNDYLFGSLLIKDPFTKQIYTKYLNFVLDKLEKDTSVISSLNSESLEKRKDWSNRILNRLKRYDIISKKCEDSDRFYVDITSKTKLFYKHQPITYLRLRELLDNGDLNRIAKSRAEMNFGVFVDNLLPEVKSNAFKVQVVFTSSKIVFRGSEIAIPRYCKSVSIIDR